MKLSTRLKIIRKFLTRKNPYIVITISPADMIKPRDGDYVYTEVRKVFDRRLQEIKKNMDIIRHYRLDDSIRAHPPRGGAERDRSGGQFFTGIDARVAYAVVRHHKPSKIVEIGSGYSTHLLRRAAQDAHIQTKILCIDPRPQTDISSVADDIYKENVVDVDLGVFDTLADGDIVFLDGSHLAFNGTDVPHFFLTILPRIPKGVFVHIHDIMLPYEYDELFTSRYYNEQYLLGTLIINSQDWVPFLPVYFLVRNGMLEADGDGGSYWMRKG